MYYLLKWIKFSLEKKKKLEKWKKILEKSGNFVSPEKWESCKVCTGDSRFTFKLRYCRLPLFKNDTINHRYMPTLGNGHIGATVYYPWLYLNGLFNGKGGRLH